VTSPQAGAATAPAHELTVTVRDDGTTILDGSGRHDEESMRQALKTLATLARGRRSVAVLGQMSGLGAEHLAVHDAVGRLVVRLNVSLTVAVGHGARRIADAAAHEGSWGQEVAIVDDVAQATALLDGTVVAGDVVLVAGDADLGPLVDALTGGPR
jgi:UDP-N-acetylmuramoyl-tripeptide--D-alanyl-D-alanine ligase